MESARAAVEVTAGLLPPQPMDQYTRRWVITSAEWSEALAQTQDAVSSPEGKRGELPTTETDATALLLAKVNGQALAYASYLMHQPDRVNFVRLDWVWF